MEEVKVIKEREQAVNEWFSDPKELADAVDFVMQYWCCFGWNALARDKTPCTEYSEDDIPAGLTEALTDFVRSLPRKDRSNLNSRISVLLGECFYVKETTIVKILSRILAFGDLRNDKDVIRLSLMMQLDQRMKLLEKLEAYI